MEKLLKFQAIITLILINLFIIEKIMDQLFYLLYEYIV